MCYNEPVSWITLIIGTLFTLLNIFSFSKNYEILALSLYWFSAVSMQLWEALIYRFKDNQKKCSYYTKIAAVNNIMQPLVLLLLLSNRKLLLVNKQLAIIVAIIYLFLINKKMVLPNYCAYDKKLKHITFNWWNEKNNYLYFVVNIILILLLLTSKIRIFQLILFAVSFIISLAIRNKYNGSIWCWIAAFIPIVNFIYFKYVLKIKN